MKKLLLLSFLSVSLCALIMAQGSADQWKYSSGNQSGIRYSNFSPAERPLAPSSRLDNRNSYSGSSSGTSTSAHSSYTYDNSYPKIPTQLNGYGSSNLSDGSHYDGNWKDGTFDGQGTRTWKDGRKYTGYWKDGDLDGQGVLTWANGQKFSGNFKAGKYEGTGTINCADGRVYTGEWKNGLENGKGTLTWPTGEKYDGSYKDGTWDGYGIMTWPTGEKYQGDFKNNTWNGVGIYTTAAGVKCIGIYADGKPTGTYTEYFKNGNTKLETVFKDTLSVGNRKEYYENGQLKLDLNYDENGALDGVIKAYYATGKLWTEEVYKAGKLWEIITDRMPNGNPTGSHLKDGDGVAFTQNEKGITVEKTIWENGVAVKREPVGK